MYRLLLFCAGIVLLLPLSALAVPVITCHCFTDRSFDASSPALADPYFLATAQNSFFAALFKVDRKTIVLKKQSGTSADDLWVAYWIASKSGMNPELLLEALGKKGSWKEAVVSLGFSAKPLGERLTAEIASGASAVRLSGGIVDGVLLRHRMLNERELVMLRKEWASNQEVIITSLVAAKLRRPAIGIYRDVKKGSKSWGAFLEEAKTESAVMQSEFAVLLGK